MLAAARLQGGAARDERATRSCSASCGAGRHAHAAPLRHYDGQPVDPKAWQQADPFAPILRAARVDGGGTEIPDIAGLERLPAGVAALRPLGVRRQVADRRDLRGARRARGRRRSRPTWNVRVILDGEEEASSPSLVPAIAKYRDKLAPTRWSSSTAPSTRAGVRRSSYGARGIVTLEPHGLRAEGRRPQRQLRELGAESGAAARVAAGHDERR